MRRVILASPKVYATAYTKYPLPEAVYAKRARLFEAYPELILIVGCGFGGLVKELRRLGKNAWGIDASEWAVRNRVSDYVWLSDLTKDIDTNRLLELLGSFATIISEDTLPWLTDEEAIQCAKNCARLGRIVIHLVTEQGEADYNYRSCAYWRNLTNQLTHPLEGL